MRLAANKAAALTPQTTPAPAPQIDVAANHVTIDTVRVAAKQTSDAIQRATERLNQAAEAALERSGK